jgi:molecular chaperone IbpA|tara:strand:- start:365 stop:838 length:474 start_codon:yes stop_codon:yes gene_type:complete
MVQFRASHTPLNFGDFEKALGFSIGFDSMFDRLLGDSTQHVTNNQGFPPYNIRRDGDTKYFIEMAVAGLSEEDLEVELKESVLQIRSKQSTEDEANYVHRGIAKRTFERAFTLSDDIVVKGCDLTNGMLTVELEKIIPEEKQARLIPIGKKKIKSIN